VKATPIGFLQIVTGDVAPCPHLHVDRRVQSGIENGTDTVGIWYRDVDHCHDCGADIEAPAPWVTIPVADVDLCGGCVVGHCRFTVCPRSRFVSAE
jgi:hypothetical protein